MIDYEKALSGKRILVTGHTGFTGSWASLWLKQIGAEVFGYSLAPETSPNLYSEARVSEVVQGIEADIRDFATLKASIAKFEPDLILHLAAQPLVRRGYLMPRETFEINAQGTANLLAAASETKGILGILCITTDKVYRNFETRSRFKESDELGGLDPYSASKVATEFIVSSYRQRNLAVDNAGLKIAVARGGNIIGGGDWSKDRIVPDFFRAMQGNYPLELRNPHAIRPWQHVLALVEGYFAILAGLISEDSDRYSQAFNLGPLEETYFSVGDLVQGLIKHTKHVDLQFKESNLKETGILGLDSNLAKAAFGWDPLWPTVEVVEKTATWYQKYLAGIADPQVLCLGQIAEWTNARSKRGASADA